MKTLFIYLVLAIYGGALHAQEITELKEAKVGFFPLSSEVVKDGDRFIYNVKENYAGEFEKDPTAFLANYFTSENFVSEVKKEKYDSYTVTLKSKKGKLEAHYDRDGNLRKTSEKFENIILPNHLRHQLYRDHKGWTMVKNMRVKNAKDGIVNKNFYRIKMELDNKTRNIRIDASLAEDGRMASN